MTYSDKLPCSFLKFWPKFYGSLRRVSCVEFVALDSGRCPPKQPYTTIVSIKPMNDCCMTTEVAI